ncbi:hypothetical protein O181_008825, partial [Austropuccinia psidii MF-1]|nr:hypothetical protein [Austropuccinia psidii MF-1]
IVACGPYPQGTTRGFYSKSRARAPPETRSFRAARPLGRAPPPQPHSCVAAACPTRNSIPQGAIYFLPQGLRHNINLSLCPSSTRTLLFQKEVVERQHQFILQQTWNFLPPIKHAVPHSPIYRIGPEGLSAFEKGELRIRPAMDFIMDTSGVNPMSSKV